VAVTEHPEGALHTGSIADDLATAAAPLLVKVVSPARTVFDGVASHLRIETIRGSMGVWPRHADIVAALGVGPMVIQVPGRQAEQYAVWGGFLKVGGNKCTVLVDRAARADEVDAEAVRQELDAVIADLAHPATDEEFCALLDKRRWCESRLRIAR
jgi:F-type H+-transporting ATPase subunit epsilon